MLTPDRNIVRKIKEYDPDLYVVFNQKQYWFELWRRVTNTNVRINQRLGDQLVTPITQSIYDSELPREFVQLDERILWWIQAADSHRHGGSTEMWKKDDEAWKDDVIQRHKKRGEQTYDRAKDLYHDVNNFYYADTKAKKVRPKFNNYKPEPKKFLRPDSVGHTSNRLYARTKGNAKAYNYKGK